MKKKVTKKLMKEITACFPSAVIEPDFDGVFGRILIIKTRKIDYIQMERMEELGFPLQFVRYGRNNLVIVFCEFP